MAKSKRPARRWFGRPKEGPGPQETFEGQFQVDMPPVPPAPTSHQGLGLSLPAATQSTPSVHRSISAPVRGRRGRGDVPGSSRHGRLQVELTPVPGPSRRHRDEGHRPSMAGHRQTRSHPTVSTQHAAMGTYNRSQSSGMLALDMRARGSTSTGEPSSWPGPMPQAHNAGFHSAADGPLAISPPSNRGLLPQVQTPSTPGYARGQYSGSPPVWSSVNTPSSGSVSLLSPPDVSYSRYRSYDLPESSPTDMPSPGWQYPSPSPTSMRGASIPPSVQSEPSPRMDWLVDNFSPAIGPVDGGELPPLTPDMIDFSPEELMWDQMAGTAQPQSTAVPVPVPAPELPSPTPFGASRSSTSVPDDLRWSFSFPDSIIESSQPVFTYSSDTPYELQTHDARYPRPPPPPGHAQASTHALPQQQQQQMASGLSAPHAGHLYPQAPQASTSTHRQRSYSASAYAYGPGHVYPHPPHPADPRLRFN